MEDCRRLRIPSVSQVGTGVGHHAVFWIKVFDMGSTMPFVLSYITSKDGILLLLIGLAYGCLHGIT